MVFRVLQVNVAKALRKLDNTNRIRIRKPIEEIAANPWKAGKQLNPSTYWGLQEGDYRAIYEIDKEKNQVVAIFIGHRKKVYDDFAKML